jgi:hypothetical protein
MPYIFVSCLFVLGFAYFIPFYIHVIHFQLRAMFTLSEWLKLEHGTQNEW